MRDFNTNNTRSLLGIIDYEISKQLKKTITYVFVLPELKFWQDTSKHAQYVKNTVEYIKRDGKQIISISKKHEVIATGLYSVSTKLQGTKIEFK